MWFGTWDHGGQEMKRSSNTWTYFTKENSGLPNNITGLTDLLWKILPTICGLPAIRIWQFKMDLPNLTVQHGPVLIQITAVLPGKQFWGSLIDSKGNIWLAVAGMTTDQLLMARPNSMVPIHDL